MSLFGFDKLNNIGLNEPDGEFDYNLGMTYEPETSEIIFPAIQPFGENIPKLLNDYKYQAIYDTTKYYLSPEDKFIIKGRYKY